MSGEAAHRPAPARDRRTFELIVRFRVAVTAVFAVASVFFAAQLPKLRIDPDTESFVPKAHPVRAFWKETKERFAVGKDIFVAIEADGPDGVFTPEILAGIARLTEGIEALSTVVPGDVRSIANAEAITGTDEGLEIEPFYEAPPETAAEAAEIRRKVFDNDVYLDRLVSRDGTIAVIIVQAHDRYEDNSPYAHPVEVFREISDYVAIDTIPGTKVWLAGTTAVESAFGRQITADLAKLIPVSLMVVVIVLFLCFPPFALRRFAVRALLFCAAAAAWNAWRPSDAGIPATVLTGLTLSMLTVRGVLLPALVVINAVVWTWGTQALLGMPIYITGTLVPPILLATGCADGIHILERYFDAAESSVDNHAAIVTTMSELWRPVVLTSVTTAIGFGSLMLGRMTIYQVFGLTTALGILAAMLMSLLLLPALLAFLPPPARRETDDREGVVLRALTGAGARIASRGKLTLGVSAVAAGLFLISATRLRVDYSWVESLQPGTPVLEADRVLRTRHGGTMPMDIVVTARNPGGIEEPELLRAIDTSLKEIAEHPAVGDTRSIAEYVKRMNEAMNEDRRAEFRIPDDRDLVAQYLLLYSVSGDPGELDDVVDYAYQGAHLGVLMRSDWLSDINEVVALADDSLDRNVRVLGAHASITGSVMIMKTIFEMILYGQVSSLITATVLVFAVLVVLFRSLADALTCMIPSLFTAVASFGCMALFDKPLGPGEAMISAIALGIGIDYAIHFMARLRLLTGRGLDVHLGIVETMRSAGRAILFNAVVVVAGFVVLALSKSPSNASFGLLIAANMALCCVAALSLLPAALAVRPSALAHESARGDLGSAPR